MTNLTAFSRYVDLGTIDTQRILGWSDFGPEVYCHRCGGRNVYSWHAPDEVWNRLRAERLLPTSDIVCPQCFTDLAQKLGVTPSVWKMIDGDTVTRTLEVEARLLFPAIWKAHEYLRRTDAPDDNKVVVVLRLLDNALIQSRYLCCTEPVPGPHRAGCPRAEVAFVGPNGTIWVDR